MGIPGVLVGVEVEEWVAVCVLVLVGVAVGLLIGVWVLVEVGVEVKVSTGGTLGVIGVGTLEHPEPYRQKPITSVKPTNNRE